MRELSLFTGAGGGLLGTVHLLGWRPVGYVEWDEYCCRVIEQRIKDGFLPDAPIWQMDIREFNARVAERYAGMVDVITAGFPCQPHSVAGDMLGGEDERDMWPATLESIGIVGPRFAMLENVPGLLVRGYFGTILRDLAECGAIAQWKVLSASEVGSSTEGKRVWIVATSTSERLSANMLEPRKGKGGRDQDTNSRRGMQSERQGRRLGYPAYPPKPSDKRWTRGIQDGWITPVLEPGIHGVAGRVPDWMERVKAVGNCQFPDMAATAWRLLSGG